MFPSRKSPRSSVGVAAPGGEKRSPLPAPGTPALEAPVLEVYRKLHRALQAVRRLCVEERLTCAQALALLALREKGPMSLTQLVEATSIDRSTMSDLLRRLHRAGLLSRRRAQDDRRALLITMTPEGAQALAEFERTAASGQADIDRELAALGIALADG